MGEDETGTLTALKELRTTLIDPAIAEYQGRIVKLMGDGALVEFTSVVDAVKCAGTIAFRDVSDCYNRWDIDVINPGDILDRRESVYG